MLCQHRTRITSGSLYFVLYEKHIMLCVSELNVWRTHDRCATRRAPRDVRLRYKKQVFPQTTSRSRFHAWRSPPRSVPPSTVRAHTSGPPASHLSSCGWWRSTAKRPLSNRHDSSASSTRNRRRTDKRVKIGRQRATSRWASEKDRIERRSRTLCLALCTPSRIQYTYTLVHPSETGLASVDGRYQPATRSSIARAVHRGAA